MHKKTELRELWGIVRSIGSGLFFGLWCFLVDILAYGFFSVLFPVSTQVLLNPILLLFYFLGAFPHSFIFLSPFSLPL
jgi:hypothetical protein